MWTGDADTLDSDFLAVIDVRRGSPTYARILSTVPVGARATRPHHTEHQVERDQVLFANGFAAGRTFRFDLTRPDRPRLLGSFAELGGFSFPHSFVRLEGGHLLATFQGRGRGNAPPGGLVELDRQGRLVRATSARAAAVDSLQMRPYSLAVLPAIDRVVSTSTDMRADFGAHLQVWRLSDLALLQTIELPATKAGDGHVHEAQASTKGEDHHLFPGEPRVLSDGRTVLLATFSCGFYRVTDIDGPAPRIDFLRAFGGENCAVPMLVGSHWVQTVPDEHALVTLDVSDPARPREVARVTFDSTFKPHWLGFDEGGSRLVVDDGARRLYLVELDRRTGALEIDQSFRDPGAAAAGVSFARAGWPHGATGDAVPHGAVFSRLPSADGRRRFSGNVADTLDVAPLVRAPVVDGRVGNREYGAPALQFSTGAGDVRVWLGRHDGFVYIAADLPDSSFYWGDDFVVSLDPAGDGGSSPNAGDRQWYLRRVPDSSVVTTAEAGRWYSPGHAPAPLGPSRHGSDWDIASTSSPTGWAVEMRVRATAFKSGSAAPRLAFRTYDDNPAGWWSWPLAPNGVPPQRVERSPDLWIPLRLP